MKFIWHIKFKLILFLLCFLLIEINAQNLNIKEINGTINSLELGNIKNIIFQSGNIIVSVDSSSRTCALINIRNLNFDNLTTDIPRIDKTNNSKIFIFQNPITDQIKISIESVKNEVVGLEIINIQGNVLYKRYYNIFKGINYLNVSASDFPKGIYICYLKYSNKVDEIKLFKK